MKTYTLPVIWDARKFAIRYGLTNGVEPAGSSMDFFVGGDGKLVVNPDFKIIDDPPIFDLPDPFIPVPSGVKIHHWPEMIGWIGEHKILATENGGALHHECYYIVADTQADLDALWANPNMQMQEGQPAYVKAKKAIVVWDGTKWK